jgi:hypothetical protein
MLHTTMIALHAAAGVAAFVAGCFALVPPKAERRARQLFGVYLVALGLMLVFLLAAVASHWRQLSTAEQVIFGGLFLPGLCMAWRALSAWGLLRRQRPLAGALQGAHRLHPDRPVGRLRDRVGDRPEGVRLSDQIMTDIGQRGAQAVGADAYGQFRRTLQRLIEEFRREPARPDPQLASPAAEVGTTTARACPR